MRAAVVVVLVVLMAGCATSKDGGSSEGLVSEDAFDEYELGDTAAENGVIRGIVVDNAITPLAGALVEIKSLKRSVETNAKGAFAFKDVAAGAYVLDVTLARYTSAQGLADVAAGDKEPALNRIILSRIAGTEPSVEQKKFDGIIQCGMNVPGLGFQDGCFIWTDDLIGIGSTSREYPVFGLGNVQAVQFEHTWEPRAANSERLCTLVYAKVGGGDACGPSPLVRYWDAETALANDVGVKDEYKQIATYPDHAIADASGNIVVDQSYTSFSHAFYNFVPTDGWTFAADGEYPVPS